MALLVSYDIEDNYLRQKIANYILDVGLDRVQYSVYIGTIKESVEQNLRDWLNKLPQQNRWQQQDSVMIIALTQHQIQEMQVIGNPHWDKDELSGDQHTLIL